MSIEKTTEKAIGEILVGETVQKTVRLPQKLIDRLNEVAPKKWGAVAQDGFTTTALCYFAARGILDWESGEGEGTIDRRRKS